MNEPVNFEGPHILTSPVQDLLIRDALDHSFNLFPNPYDLAHEALTGPNGELFDPVNPFTGDITNNQGDWIGWEDPYTGNVYNSQGNWAGWDKSYGQTFSVADVPSVTPVVVSAPPLSKNEQAKLMGLARLAMMYNPYWGYLPTTNTTNWAGGVAGLPGGGSPWATAGSPLYGPRQATSGLGALLKAVDDKKIIALEEQKQPSRIKRHS